MSFLEVVKVKHRENCCQKQVPKTTQIYHFGGIGLNLGDLGGATNVPQNQKDRKQLRGDVRQ